MLRTTRSLLIVPALAAFTALAACLPFGALSGFPSLPGPQAASAQAPAEPFQKPTLSPSTAEQIARGSVPTSGAIATAAGVAELVPVASVPATVVERFFNSYHDEMVRQIVGLEAKIAAGQPVNSNSWMQALVAAAGAGGLGILAGRRKQGS